MPRPCTKVRSAPGRDGRRRGSARPRALPAAALPALAALLSTVGPLAAQDASVVRIATEGPGSVNAYILDVGSGIAVVDAQRAASEGQALGDRARATGEAVVAILVTHPHPDHVGGLAALEEATQAPVYGSSDTAVEIGADTRKLLALTNAMDPAGTVATPPQPSAIVAGGDTVRVGDLDISVLEFAASEASNMTVYVVPALNAVFTGDLVNPGMTPFLLEKRTQAWLAQLDDLEAKVPAGMTAYPGHGAPGQLGALIAEQRAWLTDFRARVKDAAADGVVTEAEAAAIEAATPDLPPVATIPDLMKRNVIAVTAELAGDPGAPPLATAQ